MQHSLVALSLTQAEDALVEEFSLLEDWEERYEHILNMRTYLPPFPESGRVASALVPGCMSALWLVSDFAPQEGVIRFAVDSDALISLGLAAMLWRLVSGRHPADIVTYNFAVFTRLHLHEALSVRRGNGFASLIDRVKAHAHRAVIVS